MSGSGPESSTLPPPPPPPPQQTPPQQAPHTLSTIKLPILKKGEYDIWAMKMEHYLSHTDYPIWEVIQKGNGPVQVSKDTNGQVRILPPKTAEETLARERERKAITTLLMAIPEDNLARFHRMDDAKEMWDAIKSRFGGNDESKKMQKYILKQQFEGFTISNSEGLHKGYERFQNLLSQLEIHGAGVSNEDANQKFLRSLPSSWSQVSLVMRTKPGLDILSFDDLYNNLRAFESDVKSSNGTSSSTQNVAFVSSENTDSTNNVSTAYVGSTTSGNNLQKEFPSSSSLLTNQSSLARGGHDLCEIEKFLTRSGEERLLLIRQGTSWVLTRTKVEEEGIEEDCSCISEEDTFALRASAKFQTQTELEVTSYSNECIESYANLKKLCDEQKEQLGIASIEIQAYEKALKQVEAQLVAYQKSQLCVFDTRSSDLEDTPENDRYAEGMHAVPPPMSGISIPSGPEKEIDESQFTYGPRQSNPSESDSRSSDFTSCESKSSSETFEFVPEPVASKTNLESQPKVWTDAPIIEEYESDSDDDCVSTPSKEQKQPSFAFVNTDKHVKTSRENVTNQYTHSKSPKVDKNRLGYDDPHKALKAQVRRLKKQTRPFIRHHKAWQRAVMIKKQQKQKPLKSSKKRKDVSKQGRKSAKAQPFVPKDTAFDDLEGFDGDFDGLDHIKTKDYNEGGVSTEAKVSTDKPKVSTDKPEVSTDKPQVSTVSTKVSTDKDKKGTDEPTTTPEALTTTPIAQTPTPTTFGDDQTIAQVLLNMSQAKAVSKEKEKGVEIKDVERQRVSSTRSVLTL
ncbi:hypothetical protein Tco_0111778, partial [Tanacetum coccineum]